MAPQYQNEAAAREFLEAQRWPEGPVCPHCAATANISKLTSKPESKHQLRKGVYKCGACRHKFTVTVGTIFEHTRIPLHHWLRAIHLMSVKVMTAQTLKCALNLGSHRTAQLIRRRIVWTQVLPRHANDAVRQILCIKPAADMPRPGTHPTKSEMKRLEDEFGSIFQPGVETLL